MRRCEWWPRALALHHSWRSSQPHLFQLNSSIFTVFKSNSDQEINDLRTNPLKHANCIYSHSIFKCFYYFCWTGNTLISWEHLQNSPWVQFALAGMPFLRYCSPGMTSNQLRRSDHGDRWPLMINNLLLLLLCLANCTQVLTCDII